MTHDDKAEPAPEPPILKKEETPATPFKDSWLGIFGPSGIAFLAALLATFLGQQINASVETSKVVRAKLEEAYFRTLTLPQYAININEIAISPIQAAHTESAQIQYNTAVMKYNEEVAHLVAVADLYEDNITGSAHALQTCSSKFVLTAGNYFISSYRVASRNLTNTPFSPQELNALVALRQECEADTADLRKVIATAMKRHLSHWFA